MRLFLVCAADNSVTSALADKELALLFRSKYFFNLSAIQEMMAITIARGA